MDPEFEDIIDASIECFPELKGSELDLVPITKGGSDRSYYRLEIRPAQRGCESMIFMQYTDARPDNLAFAPATQLLSSFEIAVPEIFSHDEPRMRIWMNDLGGDDLWTFRERPFALRKPLYEQALQEALKLHRHTEEDARALLPHFALEKPFTHELYRWEQDYFIQNFLGRCTDLPPDAGSELFAEGGQLNELALELADLPRFLVHRDFQSQNVIVREDRVYLIDYQGVRAGRPEYDVASLLLDPYVDFSDEERATLLRSYATMSGQTEQELLPLYRKCAAQRLMQALGAYGFLGHEKKKTEFLAHIPSALRNLRATIAGASGLDSLVRILDSPEVLAMEHRT